MRTSVSFAGGVVLGTAIGLLTGILVAPASGKQMRKKLKKKTKRYSKDAILAVQQYLGKAKKDQSKEDDKERGRVSLYES